MLRDYVIQKPPTLKGYQLHQLVEGLTNGGKPLFSDMGDKLIVRSEQPISDNGTPIKDVKQGSLFGFELRACVSKKIKGRHVYYPTRDWRSRHSWLSKQGEKNGFEPLTINCQASMARIDDGKGRVFTVDDTNFVGVLRVTDERLFANALTAGVGSTAKAFGFGMLVI